MISRLACLVLIAAVAAPAAAQTVRFRTSVGAFDMLLNPTNNPNLQPLVDNMLANVASGIYRNTVVNRAPEDFVLQIGSFQSENRDINAAQNVGFDSIDGFSPIVVDADGDGQVDFDTSNLPNVRGTVSLALSAGNPNSGTTSFFVNLSDDNTFLDPQGFVPFATIADMTTVDRIAGGTVVDLSDFVGQSGSLAYTDVPLDEDNNLIFLETVSVVSESNFSFIGPLKTALAGDPLDSLTASSGGLDGESDIASLLSNELSSELLGATSFQSQAYAVPEPTSCLLVASALLLVGRRRSS